LSGAFFGAQASTTPVGRRTEPRGTAAMHKENVNTQSSGGMAGNKAAALRPRSNGHDSSVVQELTEQVPLMHLLVY